jgi:hypothetical protein
VAEATIGVVATVRNPGPSFRTWIAHHLRHVDRLYIFLDKPGTGDEQWIPDDARVVALAGAQESSLTGQSGVMQRQAANVGRAIERCRRDGIEWLLHIDADELLWPPHLTVKSFLRDLDDDVSQVTFVNHEVVNQECADEDYFRALHLFKRNGYEFPPNHWIHSRKLGFFHLYGNGKSAVRVDKGEGLESVHAFRVTGGRTHVEWTVCVLHYPCATYNEWLKKHAYLGDFLPFWWDNPQAPIEFRFLIDSRDAYLAALKSGNWDIAKAFYRTSLFSDQEVSNLLQIGAAFRADPLQ